MKRPDTAYTPGAGNAKSIAVTTGAGDGTGTEGRRLGRVLFDDGQPFSLFCTRYQSFYRAVRWFNRMKWKGLLPARYNGLAASIPEPKTIRTVPRPKGWARGGTAPWEQGRAERKARRRAKETFDRGQTP